MDAKEVLIALSTGKITPEEAKAKLLAVKKCKSTKKSTAPVKSSIAVVGISGRYPQAKNINEYWDILQYGKNTIQEIPKTRFDVNQYFSPYPPKKGRTYCKWFGMLEEIEYFDPLFFNISPYEAERMDPHQRIFLQETYHAFEDAGYNKKSLMDTNCGVYLGIMGNEYGTMLLNHQVKVTDITGDSSAITAARISYFFNLTGPAISVNTACSSSLVCTDIAYHALLNHEIDMALVGGVSLYLTPNAFINMCSTGMLSSDGQCKTFDNSADGFVPSEGVGAVVLKRLEDAEADGDHIYGIIIASGVNQDGKTNGITAPSMKRQKELETDIYKRYDIDPESITYAEMHGTGTKLGDPIELKALAAAFQEKTTKKNYCAIGSVKSNMGHTSAVSGLAGLQKVLLCLKNKKLVPTIHYRTPNEHFDFEESPFYVNLRQKEWESTYPRRACVSSFGFSGTNAHIVIEEHCSKEKENLKLLEDAKYMNVCILSAKDEEDLKQKAMDLLKCLEENKDYKLEDILYTLQVGREEMECRAGFLTASREELCKKIENIAKQIENREIYIATCKKGTRCDEAPAEIYKGISLQYTETQLIEIIMLWIKGHPVDWKKFYTGINVKRLSLPGYPFKKVRCWIFDGYIKCTYDTVKNQLHPLVHQNVSNLEAIRFISTFTGSEPFLEDHKICNRSVLSGAAFVEMIRVSILEILDEKTKAALVMKNKKLILEQLYFLAQFRIEKESINQIEIKIIPEVDRVFIKIYNHKNKNVSRLLCKGKLRIEDNVKKDIFYNIDSLKEGGMIQTVTGEECYKMFQRMGVQYGKSHRGIQNLYIGDEKVIAQLSLTKYQNTHDSVPVGLLDSAFQASVGLVIDEEISKPCLPYYMEECELIHASEPNMWAILSFNKTDTYKKPERTLNISLINSVGLECIRIRGFVLKEFQDKKEDLENNRKNLKEKIVESIARGEMSKDEFKKLFQLQR